MTYDEQVQLLAQRSQCERMIWMAQVFADSLGDSSGRRAVASLIEQYLDERRALEIILKPRTKKRAKA